MKPQLLMAAQFALVAYVGCSSTPVGTASAPDKSTIGLGDLSDAPIDGVGQELEARFNEGDALFDLPYRDADGLGPLYIRTRCSSCHNGGARGPGLIQTMAVVESDGATPAADQSRLAFGHTARALLAAGAKTPISPPPGDPNIRIGIRLGPPVFGRGYMEAVLDSEIERVEREQAARTDGIHGRINRVVYPSEANPDTTVHTHKKGDANLIGRFGLKARTATLDDFAAGALQGDIGITSPLRPNELPNPDGLTDDLKRGVDVPIETVNTLANYVRLLAIPTRAGTEATERGRELFDRVKCSVCHVPSLKTRPDYPLKVLAGIDAHVFTDFLLHNWGNDAADGMTDGQATSQSWRTAPLVGLRFNKTFLHDGHALSVEQAILFHDNPGSEPSVAAKLFLQLSQEERTTLVDYVSAL